MVSIIRKSSELAIKNLFRIQYASDLHLEMNNIKDFSKVIKPVAPFLALVGDIGHIQKLSYRPFFDYVSSEFEKVFYVPGNHEYYSVEPSDTFHKLDVEMKYFCDSYENIHYLVRNSYKFDHLNVGIIGSPFWTPHFSSTNIQISKNQSLFSEYSNVLHQVDYTYIDNICRKYKNTYTQTVVLTHFMPSFSLISNKYRNYPNNHNFASHSDHLFNHNIQCWIYGHTHEASSKTIKNTFCTSNPYGHNNKFQTNGFCNQMFVEFKIPSNEDEDYSNNNNNE